MDRRQLLLGATALGLVTNLNLKHLLNAQVGEAAMGNRRLSDRERIGLRGPVKICSDFNGDEAESMCDAEYSADGMLLVWRGRISDGSRAERVYSYDGTGKLIGVTGGGVDGTDEIRYDELGRKTVIRTVPPRPDRRSVATGVGAMFEITEQDGALMGGGTVTTRYNENDQPLETLVRDAHGELLTRIDHDYDLQGRLVHETLVRDSIEFPEFMIPAQYREQFSDEQRQIMRAQVKNLLGEHEGFRSTERSYVYDHEGRVSVRQMTMGAFREDVITTYNEHGDDASVVTTQSGSFDPKMERSDGRFEVSYLYQYDSHGNWTQQATNIGFNSDRQYLHHRKLTYY
jgi:hypothetical protein